MKNSTFQINWQIGCKLVTPRVLNTGWQTGSLHLFQGTYCLTCQFYGWGMMRLVLTSMRGWLAPVDLEVGDVDRLPEDIAHHAAVEAGVLHVDRVDGVAVRVARVCAPPQQNQTLWTHWGLDVWESSFVAHRCHYVCTTRHRRPCRSCPLCRGTAPCRPPPGSCSSGSAGCGEGRILLLERKQD